MNDTYPARRDSLRRDPSGPGHAQSPKARPRRGRHGRGHRPVIGDHRSPVGDDVTVEHPLSVPVRLRLRLGIGERPGCARHRTAAGCVGCCRPLDPSIEWVCCRHRCRGGGCDSRSVVYVMRGSQRRSVESERLMVSTWYQSLCVHV
jgi:hypothetical protein